MNLKEKKIEQCSNLDIVRDLTNWANPAVVKGIKPSISLLDHFSEPTDYFINNETVGDSSDSINLLNVSVQFSLK